MPFSLLLLTPVLLLSLGACGKKKEESLSNTTTPSHAKAGESLSNTTTPSHAKAGESLPDDPEERYRMTYVKAAQSFSRNDLEGALAALDLSDQVKPDQAGNANLRGAIYTRKRDWIKAEEAFRRALKLQPDLPMAQFNLGEVLFLNNKYADAREKFQIFLNSQPSNDLGIYKIYLCDLLGGNDARANSFLDSLKPSPNSPIYYFAKAADAFHRGDKASATEFVTSAYRIYPPDANSTFADSLVEKGFLSGEQAATPQPDENKAKVDELKTLLPPVEKPSNQSKP